MLIQFNFENFKSFYDEVSLDMTAANIKEHEYNLIKPLKGRDKYLKVACIYGANASGKSNIIEAFSFMNYFVRYSFKDSKENKQIPIKPFAFSFDEKPSTFEVFFQYKGNEYQYGFVVNRKQVLEEWLYKRDFRSKNKFVTLFERGETIWCDNIKGAKNFIPMVEENTLFLSILANAKLSIPKEVYDWFNHNYVVDFGDVSFENFISRALPDEFESPEYQNQMVSFFNAIDVPISGFHLEKIKYENNQMRYMIYSKYKMNGEEVVLPFYEESSGTQKMLTLFIILKIVLDEGNILWIDELDAKLHPLLLRYIITLFHDENVNTKGAQLIYTTHDHYTLTKDLFRRDQIWFVEKDERLSSELYSLAEYRMEDNKKVRNDASYNKDYLLGKYGGVPILRGFDMWVK